VRSNVFQRVCTRRCSPYYQCLLIIRSDIIEVRGRRSRNAGISLPIETLKILDELRGDVPKSTFTLRLIERAFNEKNQNQSVQKGTGDQTNPLAEPRPDQVRSRNNKRSTTLNQEDQSHVENR
jgi:hypothetical protein